jgi:hypothetical protein
MSGDYRRCVGGESVGVAVKVAGTRRVGCSNGGWMLGTEMFPTECVGTHERVENKLRCGRETALRRENVFSGAVFVPDFCHGRLRSFPRSGIRPGIHAGFDERGRMVYR